MSTRKQLENYKKRKISRPLLLKEGYRKMVRFFKKIGFEKLKNDRLGEMKAKPPKVKRVFERFLQASFKKQINYYTIKIRSSFDEKRNRFNVTGKIWVLIVAAIPGLGEQIVFICYFRRVPGFEKRVIPLIDALNLDLNNRPSDSKGKFMNLEQISPRKSVWRSVNYKRNKEEKEMFFKLPDRLDLIISRQKRSWEYYQETTRKKLKIKNYEQDIRKTWEIENPENAVPVN